MNFIKLKICCWALILGLACLNTPISAHCYWRWECVESKHGFCDSGKNASGEKLLVPTFCGMRDSDGTIKKYCCLDLSQLII